MLADVIASYCAVLVSYCFQKKKKNIVRIVTIVLLTIVYISKDVIFNKTKKLHLLFVVTSCVHVNANMIVQVYDITSKNRVL